ncbi:MAG: exodeoxyribonuclease VII large subunit [Rubripirellula sp.]
MNPPVEHAVSVSELTHHIKAILEGTFPSIWVAGEISDLSRPRSGHMYFTLKDDTAHIRGVIWRGTASRMDVDIEDGQSVFCFGDVEVYAARGTYQLVIRKVQLQGIGKLQKAFQQLQAKLDAEGLFAAERKKLLPRNPRRIAVITSQSGAAIRDFLEAASSRFRGVEIVVIPAIVQGPTAAASIVRAIKQAHQYSPAFDALILTRGGGSLEDLWCFNEEPVVRAVAASVIPTISAVGHEIDVTLCDMAADLRALTPTDAATRVLPDAKMLDRSVIELQRRLNHSARMMIESRALRLQQLASRPAMRRPHEIVHLRSRYLDELDARARRSMFAKIRLGGAELATQAASLSALSPLSVLTRGYSVTLDPKGNAIQDSNQVNVGDSIRTRVHQGEIQSVVTSVDET